MGKFSLANLFGITMRESANDGSDFTNPDADHRRVFLGEDGELHKKDSAGAVTGFAGGGIAATILDAKGDIIAATAADTAARLAVGSNGTVLTAASGQSTGLEWATPSSGAALVPDLLNSPAPAGGCDAEFGGASIAPFSAIDGGSGTVTLLQGSGTGVYDAATRDGWVLLQPGTASGENVELKQDYTLPDGKCIVAALSFALDEAAASANNEIQLGICANDNDTSTLSGTAAQTLMVEVEAEGSGVMAALSYDGSSILGTTVASHSSSGLWFLRIDRVGLVYYAFASKDGFSWIYLDSKTMGTAANNVWLFARCGATAAFRIVVGCAWFREGTALAVDPFPLA